MQIEGLDEHDNRILELIKDNARMSYSEIGGSVGLTRVAVKNRMKKLEESGIIRGYRTEIDPKSLPGGVEFIMDIELVPELVSETVDQLSRISGVRRMCFLSGTSRLYINGYAPDAKKLSRFADRIFHELRGVRRVTFHVVLEVLMDVDGGIEYVERGKHRGEEEQESGT